eukprot:COSAG05_NODE_31_length_28416_cov_170.150652_9_plen_180_part_00
MLLQFSRIGYRSGTDFVWICRYTAEQQRAFSMWPAVSNAGDHTMDETNSGKEEVGHSAPVFGFLKEADMAMPSRSGMVWICSPGSPCADVRPLWPHTPEYYFTFRLDTLHTEGSYCLYTTTFTVTVTAFVPLASAIHYFRRRRRRHHHHHHQCLNCILSPRSCRSGFMGYRWTSGRRLP